jgi:hypothetical protein
MLGQSQQDAKNIKQISINTKVNPLHAFAIGFKTKKIYNIYVSMMQIGKTFRTYNNAKQVTPKGASILNLMDIDENILQKISKCFQNQQKFNGPTLEVSKNPNIRLIIAYKK